MSQLSVTTTPGVITPAYNPMYYNVYSIANNTLNFAWTQDLSIQGAKLPNPSLSNPEYATETLGSFIKSPTEGSSQYWEPSRVVQTFLSYNFLPTISCITVSGDECGAFLSNTLSYQNFNTVKTVYNQSISTYVFNGGDDRNDFRNFNTLAVGLQQPQKAYNYIPNYTYANQSRFLTHFNERTVNINDTGTLSCLNGTFSAQTLHNTFTTIKASTDAFDFTTYKNNNQVQKWTLTNSFRNHAAYNNTYKQRTKYNRVDIPAYPKNLSENLPWSFYDNYFSGTFGMISTEPHNLNVGDSIYVLQDTGFTHSSYNGVATVIEVISPYIISTNKAWAGNSPTDGGTVIKNTGTQCVLSLVDDTKLDFTGVTNDGGFARFHFTSGVNTYNVRPNAMIVTSGSTNYVTTNATGSAGVIEKVTSSTPTSILSNIAFNGNDTGKMVLRERIPSSTELFFNNIDSYKVQFNHFSGATIDYLSYGDGVTFKLDERCNKHDRIELFWLNKLGAFDSMLFKGKNTKSIDFIKETYTKRLGDMADSNFAYDVIDYKTNDFEKQNFNGYQNTSFTVSTGFISETEGERVIECMGSNVVYMYKDEVFIPVLATIESVDVKTKANEKLIYYTISLDLTYNRISQRR